MKTYVQLTHQRFDPPQSMPIPGRGQEKNDGGGYAWKISPEEQLMRFLILGTTSNTAYTSETNLFNQNVDAIEELIRRDADKVLKAIYDISDSGRAISNDPALFALALVTALGDTVAVNDAFEMLPKIARTGTDELHFAAFMNAMRGWGRSAKNGHANWYNSKSPSDLAFQVAKYQSRDGWSHRDVLRLAHPYPVSPEHDAIYKWVTGKLQYDGGEFFVETEEDMMVYDGPMYAIELLERAKSATIERQILNVIRDGATLEMIPTQWRSATVYEAVIPNLGYTALIRNLANFAVSGVLKYGN